MTATPRVKMAGPLHPLHHAGNSKGITKNDFGAQKLEIGEEEKTAARKLLLEKENREPGLGAKIIWARF